jgi:hypothetical protein
LLATNAGLSDVRGARRDRERIGPSRGGRFHNLDAYIPGDRRRALAPGPRCPTASGARRCSRTISGFTALTETLANELGPQRGAEELTANLNRVFAPLIAEVERFGGHVIYFSGDAITCWLDGDDGARATACALEMQGTMGRLGEVGHAGGHESPACDEGRRCGRGDARRFLVGDPDVQLIDVLAGPTDRRARDRGESGRKTEVDARSVPHSNRWASGSRSPKCGSIRERARIWRSSNR